MTDGVLQKGGGFLPLAAPDLAALEELFRRLVLAALVKAQRLSASFSDRLVSWRHSGFSVYGAQVVLAEERARIVHLARYLTRPPLAQQRVLSRSRQQVREVRGHRLVFTRPSRLRSAVDPEMRADTIPCPLERVASHCPDTTWAQKAKDRLGR